MSKSLLIGEEAEEEYIARRERMKIQEGQAYDWVDLRSSLQGCDPKWITLKYLLAELKRRREAMERMEPQVGSVQSAPTAPDD